MFNSDVGTSSKHKFKYKATSIMQIIMDAVGIFVC